jgi:SAM-dependent methyltransferase
MHRWEAALAIAVVTASLLVTEIMLSAIFNVTLGAINTVVAISCALLGLSASGILVYISPRLRGAALTRRRFYTALALFVAVTALTVVAIMNVPLNHGDLVYAPSLRFGALKMLTYLLALVPFIVGGICVNLLLVHASAHISELYFCDLAGAGIGCLLATVLLAPLGAPGAILASTLPAAVLVVWYGVSRAEARPLLLAPALLAVIALAAQSTALLQIKRFNTLGEVSAPRYAAFGAGAEALEFQRWAVDAWTIVRSDAVPQQWENFKGWGLSDRFQGHVPKLKLINYNLRFSTYVTEFDGDFGKIGEWLDADLISLHFILGRQYERVLNIGSGGGREVLNALYHGADKVTAVDISDVTVNDLMKGRLREFSGNLYLDPRVEAVADEGRSFLERSRSTYDLIDFTIVGGTNMEKLDVMRIDDLFTLEALRTYLSHVDGDGVFSYVMYNTSSKLVDQMRQASVPVPPYIPAVKTVAGLRMVFEEMDPGARFADHVLVAGLHGVIDPNYDLVHVIASRTPFTDAERARFRDACSRLGFVCFYPPDAGENLYADVIEAPNLAELNDALPFSILPTTDDRPFHYAFRWQSFSAALIALIANPLISTAAAFTLLGITLCILPLMGRTETVHARGFAPMAVYFAAIGAGYMLIEIVVLLRLQLYLGKPVYALSVALFAFLLSSGIGSWVTRRWDDRAAPGVIAFIMPAIGVVAVLFAVAWRLVSTSTLYLPTFERAALAVAVIFPLAFLMGMPFPLGVRILRRERPDAIPWVWAINGCFSVVGIFSSRIAGLFWGFDRVLGAGVVLYLLCCLCVALYTRARPARSDVAEQRNAAPTAA